MNYSLGNMLSRGGALNPDGLSLDLAFAADKTLTARKGPTPTFTRASTATFVGSNGLIQSAAINAPRFDHDPVTLACKGLLIEEQRTNLLTRSAEFDNLAWTPITLTVTPNQLQSPDGGANADMVTVAGANQGLYQVATVTPLATYTFSVHVKLGTLAAANFRMAFRDDTNGAFIHADVAPSQVVTSGSWTRVTYAVIAPASCTQLRCYPFRNTSSVSGTFYLWGAQLEVGSFPTSYIPTTSTVAPRSADVCSITGSDFTGMYNNSAGTFVSHSMIANLIGDNRGIAQIDSGTSDNVIRHQYSSSIGGFNTLLRANVDTPTILSATSGAVSTIQKRATAYAGTSFTSTTNGGSVTTATRTFPVGLNTLRIGSISAGSFVLNGHIARIQYFKKRLPDAKLQSLTTP